MGSEVRLTKDQIQMLQQLSDCIGTGSRTTSELFDEVGRHLVRRRDQQRKRPLLGLHVQRNGKLARNGPIHRFAETLNRLVRRGLLVKVTRYAPAPYRETRWSLGPLADLLKEQGKLLERADPH
jgi:hypothetical protein